MITKAWQPLSHIRCQCGKILPLPDELWQFVRWGPAAIHYEKIEKLTGFKVLFPSLPANMAVWMCLDCYQKVKVEAEALMAKVGGNGSFSLFQLAGLSQEKTLEALGEFEKNCYPKLPK